MPDQFKLFFIPFAGGNVYSYRLFEQCMNPMIKVVPIEPPGRGRRAHESRMIDIISIVNDLTALISHQLNQPFALFGHSMGALVAYLVTCRLKIDGLPLPRHLFISGKGPPHQVKKEAHWHTLPPDDFKRKLYEFGGCPDAVLNDRELMAYFAPIIKDDICAVAGYRHVEAPPFDVPVTVMIGTGESTTLAEANEWDSVTSADFRVLQFEGGHFFLFEHVEQICSLLYSTLIKHCND